VRATLLNVGAARVAAVGGWPITLAADEAVEVARAMPCALIVPLHFEGWEHLSESRIEMKRAIATADLERRLRCPDPSHKLAVLE
jgi:hypothetical protein